MGVHVDGESMGRDLLNVCWGPDPEADLGTEGGVAKAYQAALRERRVADQMALVDQDLLLQLWSSARAPTTR